ncbi:MAG: hypothetical protein KME30_26910 [Iphinoe sp. HA4291-MV1]|nr:hypothetical protein [Iphinoe sp. HA4291-MV1]
MNSRNVEQATANQALAAYKATHGYEPSFTKLYWCVANETGIHEALLIQIIENWCIANAKDNKRGYLHDDNWWTSATYSAWAERYPALGTPKSIQKRLLALEKLGYVLSCQPKRNQGNSVKFYRVDAVKVGTLILQGFSVVTNSDEPFYTKGPIVTNSDGVVTISDGVVTNSDVPPPYNPPTERVSSSLLDIPIKLTQSITGVTEKEEEEGSKATDQDKAVQDSRYAVNKEKVSATTSKSTHEGQDAAPRENNSQKWQCPDPELQDEFFAWQGADMNADKPSSQRSRARDIRSGQNWANKNPESADSVYKAWKQERNKSQSVFDRYIDEQHALLVRQYQSAVEKAQDGFRVHLDQFECINGAWLQWVKENHSDWLP